MSNNTILNSVIKLRYGELSLQPTKELVEFVPVPEIEFIITLCMRK